MYRLFRTLYGLKQASRAWWKVCKTFLESIGCTESQADCSLFHAVVNSDFVHILVYVDDMLIIARLKSPVQKIADLVSQRFEARLEAEVTKFLGIVIQQDKSRGHVKINSSLLIEGLLHKFGMEDARGSSTPLPFGMDLFTKGPSHTDIDMSKIPYKQLIGSILHLANTTRPDIAFSVGVVSRFLGDPWMQHWNAAKSVLRYLKKTKTMGIIYRKWHQNVDGDPIAYADSDFAGDKYERKSTSGYAVLMGDGAISWCSRKQPVIAQSTLEAEYIAMNAAIREIIWIRRMFMETHKILDITATVLNTDGSGAQRLAEYEAISDKNKHIEVRYHFNKQKIQNKTIALNQISTEDMTADILTKILGATKHKKFVKALGMNQQWMQNSTSESSPVQGE